MNAHPVLLQLKYTRVIEHFSRRAGISLRKAMDLFYHSRTYQLMREGISDMHCRSDEYLAEELELEYGRAEKQGPNSQT